MIIKSKHTGNYTVIPNEIFKNDLSMEAIGLLTYFLSLPKDWAIKKTTLHVQLEIGRDKLDRMFKELQNTGYINSVKKISANGTYTYDHIIYDKPFNGEPCTEIPLTDKPHTEKPHTVNEVPLIKKQIQSTDIINKDILSKEEKKKREIEKKENEFIQTVNSIQEYSQAIKNEFINYWTEKSKDGKMRFESQKFFDFNKRLNNWLRISQSYTKEKSFAKKENNGITGEYQEKKPDSLF